MARTIELADGVYRIATDNYRLNTGLVLGLERALVVDTGAGPRQATEIYDEVRRLTRLPITVVNTHGHYERFFGNDVFAAMGVEEFWAHPRAARAIRKYGAAQRSYVETLEPEMAHHQGAATDIVVPNHLVANSGDGITFTPIDLGERSATLMYMGSLRKAPTRTSRIPSPIVGLTPWVPCWNSTATACSCPVTASPWTAPSWSANATL